MQVFRRFRGEDVVYLKLMGSRKIIKTTSDFWVDSKNPDFAEAIFKILGQDTIVYR